VTASVESLMKLATDVVARTRELGADEASVSVSRGTHVTIQRRGRKVEQATEATNRGLVVSLLVDDRYTSNSTSDLRPEALDAFLVRCVDSARYLEADPFRRLPAREQCGRGVSEEALDQDDPAWRDRTAAEREGLARDIEEWLLAHGGELVSCSSFAADGRAEAVRVLSNGFADSSSGAWFSAGADMTLSEGDKRPESAAYYACRHLSDLPAADVIAAEAIEKVKQRLGSKPTTSGTYPMLLDNRTSGRLLGVLGGPLSGGALHEGRSCLADRLGTAIASPLLTIEDDPTIPRGLGSRPWDGDCLVSRPRTIVADGVLESYYISLYYARKMGVDPTSGGRSNWLVKPGQRSYAEIVRGLDKAIVVTGFIGGNSNAATGDFSFGIRGLLVERGEVVQSLSEMNVSGNLLRIFQQLVEVGSDPWPWSATRSPSMLFEGVAFSGT
jgi:PmbA protein